MATSAFKSTTKRSAMGAAAANADDKGSSNRNATLHRRSRSLSRFSGRSHALYSDELPTADAARGRFVNSVRGSGFPEIVSLDDLANDFFPLHLNLKDKDRDRDLDVLRGSERSRPRSLSARRASVISGTCSSATATSSMKGSSHPQQDPRRGRSVSRQHAQAGDVANASGSTTKALSDSNSSSRRRRSLSVAPCQFSDSEGDLDTSHLSISHAKMKNFTSGNRKRSSSHKPTAPDHQCLRRSISQKDLPKLYDGYSSNSALTDDETLNACSGTRGIERTIQTVYAQKKIDHPTGDGEGTALYEAMRQEVRHVVEEIRIELEQAMVKTRPSVLAGGDCLQSNNSDVLHAVAMIRKNYTSKLDQSEKRRQDLLTEIMVEEQRGLELSKIVRELFPDPEKAATTEKRSCNRKRSNDRCRMSKSLTEEAGKYFEEFISNVEDTDISSFDGERSDASSTLGGTTRPKELMVRYVETDAFGISTGSSVPVEMDGVVLPWLRWEASSDHSPLSCKSREEATVMQNNIQEVPLEVGRGFAVSARSCLGHSTISGLSGSWFDRDEYSQDSEDILLESWRQRHRISSGGLILCSRTRL